MIVEPTREQIDVVGGRLKGVGAELVEDVPEMTANAAGLPPELRRHRFRLTVRAMMLIPVLVASAAWLHVRAIERNLGPVPIGTKICIPLEFLVLDDVTGQPIQGAKVDLPFLHPTWRNRPDLRDRDLRWELSPTEQRPPPFLTDEGGRTRADVIAMSERRLKYRFLGLMPVVGSPEIVFHPVHGVRVTADGRQTWVRFLDDIREEDGRKLADGVPMSVVGRLKQATPEPMSTRE